MTWKEYPCRLTGVSPLIMDNGQMADPLYPSAIALKKFTEKRIKTEADYEEMERIKWFAALYLDADLHPCLPGELLEMTLINAARKSRKGQQAKAGMYCEGNFPLLYDGPRDAETLFADPEFHLRTLIPNSGGKGKSISNRPQFKKWEADVCIHFNDGLLNPRDVHDFTMKGGEIVGIGAWRPKFGRFRIS